MNIKAVCLIMLLIQIHLFKIVLHQQRLGIQKEAASKNRS